MARIMARQKRDIEKGDCVTTIRDVINTYIYIYLFGKQKKKI